MKQQAYIIVAVTLMAGALCVQGAPSTSTKTSADTAMPLMEKFAYKPSYSREALKTLMGDLLKLEITDADFFGRYENGRWTKAPMLDYNYNNAVLRDVEEAAKVAEYAKAADALLAYYKGRDPKLHKVPLFASFDKLAGNRVDFLGADTSEFTKGNQAQAAIALARTYLPNADRVFKREDCTARACVEYLKGVSKMGMIWSNGYCPNPTINGLGGNWIPWHSHDAVVNLVALPELVDHVRWIAKTCEYLNANLHYIIFDDGSYIEHTFGYPRKILPLMLTLRDIYLSHGFPVSDRYGKQLHRLARYMLFCAMLPDGRAMTWGEGNVGDTRRALKKAADYFADPELSWWSSNGQLGAPPEVTDVHYPDAKLSVFRSSWNEDANFLFFAPRTGGSHYHTDQNMIELYAYGQRFLRDTGMCSYSSKDPAFDFLRHQNRSHNTIEVDGKGFPRPPKGDQLGLIAGPCDLKSYSSSKAGFAQGWGGGYANVRHERDVFFVRDTGMTVVLDILKPNDDQVHTYDQCWHFDPSNTYESDAQTCKVWTTNKDAANLDMLPLYPKGLELLLREGWNMRPRTETVYPSFRQKTAGDATFVTLIRPTPQGASSRELKAEMMETNTDDVRAIEITTDQGSGLLMLSRSKGLVKAANVETDAECAYVQFDKAGKLLWAVRKGGTVLTLKGRPLSCEVMAKLTPPALPSQGAMIEHAATVKKVAQANQKYNAAREAGEKALGARDYAVAAKAYETAFLLATLDEDRSQVLHKKGLCHHWHNQPKEAVESFAKVVALKHPNANLQALSLRLLGMNYMRLKNEVKAKAAFEQFMKHPNAPANFKKGVAKTLEKIRVENKNGIVR